MKRAGPAAVQTGMSTDWQWRCTTCGHSAPARGVFRIGTSGTSRTIGRCSACDRWRVLVLEKQGAPGSAGPADAESDRTWLELTAYVSEGSMSVDIAEQIARARAREPRKREVAAQVAGGALMADDALRLLDLP